MTFSSPKTWSTKKWREILFHCVASIHYKC